jgi:uncharacterized damage-inducible protein DinB
MTPEMFAAQLQYHRWATKLVLDAVRQLSPEQRVKDCGSSHHGIDQTLAHLFKADSIWFVRAHGNPSMKLADIAVPGSIDELEQQWMRLLDGWQKWAELRAPEQWYEEISYITSEGKQYRTPAWQVALHLVNHGTLHRGQVVTMLRQAGAKAPATDLIFFYRSLEAQATAGA